jgi:hypothetical protein
MKSLRTLRHLQFVAGGCLRERENRKERGKLKSYLSFFPTGLPPLFIAITEITGLTKSLIYNEERGVGGTEASWCSIRKPTANIRHRISAMGQKPDTTDITI